MNRLAEILAGDMESVNDLIRTRMASEHAPRIPEVTAHLVESGRQTFAPYADIGCGAFVWLFRRAPRAFGGYGRIHPHGNPAA